MAEQTEVRACKRWTEQEDNRLLRQVKTYPHNLHNCFMIVAEELNRTPQAVANHWYAKLSKDPKVIVYGLMTAKQFYRNRKNCKTGTPISPSIWQRFLNLIKKISE